MRSISLPKDLNLEHFRPKGSFHKNRHLNCQPAKYCHIPLEFSPYKFVLSKQKKLRTFNNEGQN